MQQNLLLTEMVFKKKKEDLYLKASKIALENATMIHDEAKLLNDNGHSARGFALSIISLEESAKAFLFLLVSHGLEDEHKIMKFLYNHESKLQQSSRISYFTTKFIEELLDLFIMAQEKGIIDSQGIVSKSEYKKNINEWIELSKMIAESHPIKLDSIYVGVKEGKIINPNDMFKKEPISELLQMVEMQFTFVKAFIDVPKSQFLGAWKEPFVSKLNMEHFMKPCT